MKLKIKERRSKTAWGTFDTATGEITINPDATPFKRLETIIHEALHKFSPDWTEKQVRVSARVIRDALWRDGYRRIYK